ncbi:MAG: hypothetical protein MZW92_66360 [Comamonadaceae bacterium]|nr:hypothetical protein [Comamonadaceae bacterium]
MKRACSAKSRRRSSTTASTCTCRRWRGSPPSDRPSRESWRRATASGARTRSAGPGRSTVMAGRSASRSAWMLGISSV